MSPGTLGVLEPNEAILEAADILAFFSFAWLECCESL